MLYPAKTMDGILMATSIYFAAALKKRLLKYSENTWTLIMLISIIMCWFKVESLCAHHKKNRVATDDTSMEVIYETVYVISQTLGFLLIQFFITTIDGLIIEQHLFFEPAVFPTLMLLFCILLVTITKKIQAKYEKTRKP